MNNAMRFRRMTVTAAALAAAGLLSVGASASTAAPAAPAGPATSADCLYILNTSGYSTTPARAAACNRGAQGGSTAFFRCIIELQNTGVGSYVSRVACDAAS